ncbi:MAG: di-heme oxidoredictase family protein [Pseudomonadota bacterium]
MKAALSLLVAAVLSACGGGGGGGGGGPSPTPPPSTNPPPEDPPPQNEIVVPDLHPSENLSGGDASTDLLNEDAFGQAPRAIQTDFAKDANFKGGNAIFRNDHEGEGPILNARTCQGCHARDGRGAVPPNADTPMDSMSIRLGLGVDADGRLIPDPVYGGLLQTFGLASFSGEIEDGLASFAGGAGAAIGEGYAFIEYEPVPGTFTDGTAYELRKPTYKIRDLSYGDFADDITFSPRLAPAVFGLGLLEAIPAADIRALADPDDNDGDGISGRAAEVFDATTDDQRLGRIGLKASVGSILHQASLAYKNDQGVTSRFEPEEPCTQNQTSCLQVAATEPDPHPGGVDIPDIEMALVEFYVRTLAVPERRGYDAATETWEPEVLAGRTLFFEAGCGQCHQQTFQTGIAQGSILGDIDINILIPDAAPIDVLSEQTIFPYTDLLLHDMGGECEAIRRESVDGNTCGAGENCVWVQRCEGLADGRAEGDATGSEWRTSPLWGLGLVQTVNARATYLHDGRARSISEAILWHGGEAAASQSRYVDMTATERQQLLAFLESL